MIDTSKITVQNVMTYDDISPVAGYIGMTVKVDPHKFDEELNQYVRYLMNEFSTGRDLLKTIIPTTRGLVSYFSIMLYFRTKLDLQQGVIKAKLLYG